MKLYIVIVCLSTCFYSTLSIVTCPDKTSGCPDGMTCCLVSDSQYGCCPLENAVCCPDHLHCCPHGNTCDTAQGRCVSGNTGENSRWYRKRPAVQVQHAEEESNEGVESETVVIKKTRQHKPRLPWVNNRKKPQQVQEITCADQRSKCPDHTTCCEMDKGVYGCCPVEDAVCCEDHLHCCPHGTTCDTAEGKCINSQNGVETPWYKKFPSTQVHRKSAIELKESLIECENGDKCKSAGTCCMDSEDEAYCCPFSNGVCCRGGTHCCPNGFRCVSIEGKCIQEDNEIMVSMAYEPTKESIESGGTEEKTVCPDKSFCARHETCCESFDEIEQKSVYKCCKLNHATCCEDSCCPRGYHCANGKTCERTAFVRKNFYL